MLLYILIIIGGVILDQVTKQVIVATISNVTTLPLIPNILHLTYVENTGAAFSLFSDMKIFLILISLLLTVGLGYLLFTLPKTRKYRLVNIALSIIISGAIGNIIDRVRLSYVVDFIDFRLIHFAVFNVADILVVCGTFILIYAIMKNNQILTVKRGKREKKVKEKRPKKQQEIQTEITPEVKTEIKKLPDHSYESVTFEPRPLEKEDVKIYTPSRETKNTIVNTAPIPDPKPSELESSKVYRPKNRYNVSADSYEKSVKEQSKKNKEKAPKNRYVESLSRYEASVKNSSTKKPKKKESEWNPKTVKTQKKKAQPSIWNSDQVFKPKTVKPGRYTDVLDSYEKSVSSSSEKKITTPDKPIWEPVGNKKRTAEVKEEQPKPKAQGSQKTKNRYNQYTDDYIKSINDIKNKHFTDN